MHNVKELDLESCSGPFLVTSDTGRAYLFGPKNGCSRHFAFTYEDKLVKKEMIACSGDMRQGSTVEVITADGNYISFRVEKLAILGV